MRKPLAAAVLLAVSVSSAQAMTVEAFLTKAEALKAKGMMAMMSPDVGLLRTEMKTVSAAYRADIEAGQKTGQPAHSCPPPRGKGAVSSDDVMAEFNKIPAAQRSRISVKDAFYAMMKKRYPCK